MVLEGLVAGAIGYVAKSLASSEGAKTASKEMSTAIWEWIRPLFLKEVEEEENQTKVIEQFEAAPEKTEHQKPIVAVVTKHLSEHPDKIKELQNLLLKAERKEENRIGEFLDFGEIKNFVYKPVINEGGFHMH